MDHARHRIRNTVCPHPYVRMLHRPRVAASRRRHASTRFADAMRAMRCVRARFARDSRRARALSSSTERRPSRDDRASIASRGRGADRAMDSRRRRRSTTTRRRRRVSDSTRFEDSTSRAYTARVFRTARRARAETRDGGGVARARGARTRARRRGAARRKKIKRRRATRVEDESDRTGHGEE